MDERGDPQTSMQFCKECNNMMYAKEVRADDITPKLVFVCKVSFLEPVTD